jgi:hypothetical protein
MKRTPMRRVSKKRAVANAIYSKKRKAFLKDHPYCFVAHELWGKLLPTRDIHHMRKPRATYLNDETTWMAVSRRAHEWIENNKSEARERGWLL